MPRRINYKVLRVLLQSNAVRFKSTFQEVRVGEQIRAAGLKAVRKWWHEKGRENFCTKKRFPS